MAFDASPTHVRRVALVVAIVGLIVCGLNAYWAASNEMTGTAVYSVGLRSSTRSEHVTRESSPAKFRQATNRLWVGSGFSLVVSVGAFRFFRKIDDNVADAF